MLALSFQFLVTVGATLLQSQKNRPFDEPLYSARDDLTDDEKSIIGFFI